MSPDELRGARETAAYDWSHQDRYRYRFRDTMEKLGMKTHFYAGWDVCLAVIEAARD